QRGNVLIAHGSQVVAHGLPDEVTDGIEKWHHRGFELRPDAEDLRLLRQFPSALYGFELLLAVLLPGLRLSLRRALGIAARGGDDDRAEIIPALGDNRFEALVVDPQAVGERLPALRVVGAVIVFDQLREL